jgi:UDP-2-acetamido-2-deoxy-ribo-hexuluronate aminotransferase
MDTLQCAIVLAKLERFGWELQRRRELARRYHEALAALRPAVRALAVRDDGECAWAQLTVRVAERAAVQRAMRDAGVPTAVHYPKALHHQPAYARWAARQSCPHSAAAAQEVLSLPMSADLHEADLDRVVSSLAAAIHA